MRTAKKASLLVVMKLMFSVLNTQGSALEPEMGQAFSSSDMKCICKTITTYFHSGHLLILSTDTTLGTTDSIVVETHSVRMSVEITTNIRKGRKLEDKSGVCGMLLIVVSSVEEVLLILTALPPHKCQPKVIIVFVGGLVTVHIVEILLDLTFKLKLVDIVVFFDSDGKVSMYTYFPYLSGTCRDVHDVHRVGWCCDGQLTGNREIFPQKLNDLNGCPLRLSTFNYPPYTVVRSYLDGTLGLEGLEGRIVEILAESLNFTSVVTKVADGVGFRFRRKNESYVGIFDDLVHKRVDLLVAYSMPTSEGPLEVIPSTPMIVQRVVWAVPNAGLMLPWKVLALVFSFPLWVCVTLSVSFFFAVLTIRKRKVMKRLGDLEENSFLLVLSVLLGLFVHHQPKTSCMKILFISWVLHCLILSKAYRSSLIGHLVVPVSEGDINSMSQLLQSRISFGGCPVIKTFFQNSDNHISKQIYDKWVETTDILNDLNQTTYTKNFAVALDEVSLRHATYKNYRTENGELMIHVMKEPIITTHSVIFFQKPSIFTERFNTLIRRIRDSGLGNKWLSDIGGRTDPPPTHRSAEAVTMNHLLGAFVILSSGYLVSVVTFVIEHTSEKVNWRQIN